MDCDNDTAFDGAIYTHTCRNCGTIRKSSAAKYYATCKAEPAVILENRRRLMECRYRTAPIGTLPCPTCAGNLQIKIHVCALFNTRCALTEKLAAQGVIDCTQCPRREPVQTAIDPTAAVQDNANLDAKALSYRDVVNQVAKAAEVYPAGKYEGRGIVIGAGGEKFFTCAIAAVGCLRAVGCQLPVEFWYLGRSEFDPTMQAVANALGIRCVDARAIEPAPRILNGWELKPFSVIHSAFEQVLYLDADCMAAANPERLFDLPQFAEHGAIFWPDLPPNPKNRKEWIPPDVYDRMGMPRRNEPDFESGQFMVDKRRCWNELRLTMHLNEFSDYWYKHVFGDKSTYHLAWRKLGSDYAMPSKPADWSYPVIYQYDFDGKLMFQHACRGKNELQAAKPIRQLKQHETAVKAVEEMRQRWAGKIWNWADQSEYETAQAKELCQEYLYLRIGLDSRTLTLHDEGVVANGGKCEKRWTLRILDGRPTIVIAGEAHKGSEIGMIFLEKNFKGIWHGAWEAFERAPIRLIPMRDIV